MIHRNSELHRNWRYYGREAIQLKNRAYDPGNWNIFKAANPAFYKDETATVEVDFCSLVIGNCCNKQWASKLTWADKYICMVYQTTQSGRLCELRPQALWTTGADYDYQMQGSDDLRNLKNRLTVIKKSSSPCTTRADCNNLLITLQDPGQSDQRLFAILAYISALETGYTERNEWLAWMMYTAKQNGQSNCVACAKARPQLGTAPFKLSDDTDPKSLQCVLQLFNGAFVPENETCKTLALLFSPVKKTDVPPSVMVYKGNYTCFSRHGVGQKLLAFPSDYCQTTIVTHDMKLRPKLPAQWQGSCALTQLLMPFHMFPTGGSFDNLVYIDSIGVPDEFKARNQVASGFESFLFWWATINKNVDWINYIYYNQQRFVNYTRDAVKGIAEQLGLTSLMAWQNRMALDMLLAERSGVCRMFGTFCCIPNNTSPDGSITKALEGLTSLSEELVENSGVDNPFTRMMQSWFGRWSSLISSLLISLSVVAAILVTCGCGCILSALYEIEKVINPSVVQLKLPSSLNTSFLLFKSSIRASL
uniref:Uncharacterized protein n=1 Tax=Mola mola TaxID=94237 RepID=A0A3Q3WSJ8_MOLML